MSSYSGVTSFNPSLESRALEHYVDLTPFTVLGFIQEVQIYTSCRTKLGPPNLLEARTMTQGISAMMSIVPHRR
jgi:hypothetical protein